MNNKILNLTILLALPFLVFAQSHIGGQPISFTQKIDPLQIAQQAPTLDMAKIEREDAQNPGRRFAAATSVDWSMENNGQWTELPNGDRIWRLEMQTDALGLAVFYDAFYLPKGATLYMYNGERTQWKGGYTAENNPENGRFWTGFTYGPTAILEYYEPQAVRGEGQLHIYRIDQAYDASQFNRNGEVATMFGFGTADACNVNINCTEADAWQTEKQGICRVIVVVTVGSGFCTGSLVNNTAEDGTPYILSAFHCQDGFTPEWDMYRFDFNYESPDCNNPDNAPPFTSVLGAELKAGRQENDFILLKITEDLPTNQSFYFNGWNKDAGVPDSTVLIHHASGDIQKFSKDEDAATIFQGQINWDNNVTTPAMHHLELFLDIGTFEPGSSGCPFFDENRHIVGQLHGGNPECTNSETWGGRFALSWDGGGSSSTRLSDWLDPLNTGVMIQDGAFFPAGGNSIAGKVQSEGAVGLADVTLYLYDSGTLSDSTTSDATGNYSFDGLALSNNYSISLQKGGPAANGVSVIDLVKIQRHITTVELLEAPWKVIASNVSADQSISVLDVIQIRRVILSLDAAFANVGNWQFLPSDYIFPNPSNPIALDLPTHFGVGDFTTDINNLNFVGVKSGDADGDAAVD